MRRSRRELAPPATQPGFVVVEAVDDAAGGLCLVVNGIRVAGCDPSLKSNNVRYRWNVRCADWLSIVHDRRDRLAGEDL